MQTAVNSAILDIIYNAAADPTLWPEVVEAITKLFDGSHGYLSALDIVSGHGSITGVGIAYEALRVYNEYYASLNPINNVDDPVKFLRNWSPKILTDNDCVSPEEFRRTEYFNDFSLPNDAYTTLMIRLGRSGSTPQVLNVGRSARRGWFEEADRELAAAYHPHLIRAANISRRITADRALDDDAGRRFQESSDALFLTTADGKILRANTAGEALLRRGVGLTSRQGRLSATEPDVSGRLARIIAIAGAADAESREGGALALPVSPDGAARLIVSATPLRQSRRPIFEAPPCVLVCVSDHGSEPDISDAILQSVFGLTPAECRVARALVRAGDLPRAAAHLGSSPNTAKVHLSRIYDKTGVDRQVALSRIVLRSATP